MNITRLQSCKAHKHLEEDLGRMLRSDFEGTFFDAMGGCYQTLLLANSVKKFLDLRTWYAMVKCWIRHQVGSVRTS